MKTPSGLQMFAHRDATDGFYVSAACAGVKA